MRQSEDLDTEEIELKEGLDLEELTALSNSWSTETLQYFGRENRSLILAGPILQRSAVGIISQLLELDSISHEPIILFINSPGGAITDGLAIYDTIKRLNSPVIGIAIGECMSCATDIISACDFRASYENTLFMIHDPIISELTIDNMDNANETAKLYNHFKALTTKLVHERTSLSKEEWDILFSNNIDYHFTAKDALAIGLIDVILEPREKEIQPFSITKDHILFSKNMSPDTSEDT